MKVLTCAAAIALVIGLIALSGLVCMLLWNWVIVALFHVAPIDYLLGVGISLVLSVIGGAFRSATK